MSKAPSNHSHDQGQPQSEREQPGLGGNPEQLITTAARDGGRVDHAGAIIDNLDIWTAAIKTKASTGRGSNKKQELYGIKKLRELILELAVRGLLVPQDPNDEPASVLLEKITAEKEQLIKDGKLKKPKKLKPVSDEEKHFNLPDGWVWARLSEVYDVRDGTHDTPKYHPDGYPLITSKNLSGGSLNFSDVKYISEEDHKKIIERSKVDEEDILFAMIGSIGNPVLVDTNIEFSIKNVALFKYYSKSLSCPSFLLRFLFYAENILKEQASGAVQSFVSLGKIRSFPIALPPEPEQPRIVAKVDELMALCDQLEQQTETSLNAHQTLVETLLKALLDAAQSRDDASAFEQAWQRIADHFDVLFTTEHSIDQLKQTILQLAVMGKLVPQDPNDEPATVLLEKIAAEKERLVKEGKIKKQKKLPPISEEEKPFELPEGWGMAHLVELLPEFQNGASSRGDRDGKEIVVLRLADISNWKISLADTRSLKISETSIERYSISDGDVLIIRVNGSADIVGRFVNCDRDYDAIYCDHFIRMRFPIKIFSPEYLSLLGSSSLIRRRIVDLFVSTAGQKTVNQKHIGSLVVTIPPFEEQQRIVGKVEELMTMCESLKAGIRESQTTQLHLADAMAEQQLN